MKEPLRHFLTLDDFEEEVIHAMLEKAIAWKKSPPASLSSILRGVSVGLIFRKPSTRTRLSFDFAIQSMGGVTSFLDGHSSQLSRGELLSDTMKVLNGYADAVVIRAGAHDELRKAHAAAEIPVVNGLTDASHPCQVMADMMTLTEHFGSLKDLVIAWVGDCNNVARSWMRGIIHHGGMLRLATPSSLRAQDEYDLMRTRGAQIEFYEDASLAVQDAHVVMTDTWISMSDEDVKDNVQKRRALLAPYQVNDALMSLAHRDAVFLHCLPAHRGEEVTASVLDGAQSLAWQCARNRLHVQKAILAWCLSKI